MRWRRRFGAAAWVLLPLLTSLVVLAFGGAGSTSAPPVVVPLQKHYHPPARGLDCVSCHPWVTVQVQKDAAAVLPQAQLHTSALPPEASLAHWWFGCGTCHTLHAGTTNLHLISEVIDTDDLPPEYAVKTGLHTQTAHHRGDPSGDHAHFPGARCTKVTCGTVCPKSVSPARIQRTLRTLHLPPPSQNGHAAATGWRSPVSDEHAREHAHPLRTFLFANIHWLSRVGSALAPLSNWALNAPGARLVNDKVLGIAGERSLPPFARETFPAWFRKHTPRGDGHRGRVLLFHDTFMDYNYPSTGIALTEVLETAGFRVDMADMVCCGRPMISKGQLGQAAKQAVTNVTKLYDQVRDGSWLVGCEPSCLLALRDEYQDLVPAGLKDKAKVVAQQALLVDEFLDMLSVKEELGLTFRKPSEDAGEVVFHGHCHQKAFASPEKTVNLLRLAGYDAEMADAPCCGMAGSYGFEKEHYEASRGAGERALFPILRSRPQAQVAVMGTSCRQQVEHFTGRRARHMVEILREAVE